MEFKQYTKVVKKFYKNLNIYRKWIERHIKEHKDDNIEFINCSGGAFIEGMKHIKLSEV